MEKKIQSILKNWKTEAGAHRGPILFRVKDHVLYVYTSQPGYLIGYGGKLIEKYKSMILNEQFFHIEDIKLEETAYYWVN